MRLIDANALLERWCSEVCKTKPNCAEDCMMHDYLTIDSLSPTIEPETHWIPCDERLPEVSGLYLVTTNAYGVWAARTDSYSVRDKDWKRKGDKKAVITAWMPMPKPYFIESDGIKEEER